MSQQTFLTFHDGKRIPQLGLGVWQTPNDTAEGVVKAALDGGYRHVDTAAIYENEEGVGRGIAAAGVPRGELFVTTKLWNSEQGFDSTLQAFETSLDLLGLDYVDLYLIHWPSAFRGAYVESWKALIRLHEEGKVRSIGVSNFQIEHLERIVGETGVVPVINQIELHPRFQQRDLRAYHASKGILTESWSPLGQGKMLADPVIGSIAERHARSAAQVIIRWHIQHGLVVIPKSVTPSRIAENFNVFDFSLNEAEMAAIDGLDFSGGRIGPNPDTADF